MVCSGLALLPSVFAISSNAAYRHTRHDICDGERTAALLRDPRQWKAHTADTDRPLTIEALASDVIGLLEQLGIEQADVFGFSLGGFVAYAIALGAPDRVGKLIVASPVRDAVEVFELLPNAQLAVLPGTTHVGVTQRPAQVLALITPFLDAR